MTAEDAQPPAKAVAFFDVDGTLTKTTIVDHYAHFRRSRMSPWVGRMWFAAFLVKCLYYLVLDKIDRGRLNVVFYRSYAGMSAAETKAQVGSCYRTIIKPRQFQEAPACLTEHRAAGREIVLVTGSIDFVMTPLAKALDASAVLAPSLVESNGRFTGELTGPPIAAEEKAKRLRRFADEHGVDLARSFAYGDSIADLPMLEAVGFPHVVNPDRKLAAKAMERGWPIHNWTVAAHAP